MLLYGKELVHMSEKTTKWIAIALTALGAAASFIGGRISDKSSEAKRSKDAEKYLDKKFDEYIKNKD